MKEITLTCPFTGLEFKAFQRVDGSLVVIHPLTDEQLTINWNSSCERFYLPKQFFTHIETLNRSQVAEILGVSHQRVTQIIKDETIPIHYIGNNPVFVASDVYQYRDTRKVGAPRKVKTWE